MLLVIGERLMAGRVCGLVLAMRRRGDSIAIWTNTIKDEAAMRAEIAEVVFDNEAGVAKKLVFQPHRRHIDFGQQH